MRELETSPTATAYADQVRAGVAVGLSGGSDSLALVHGLLRCGVKVHAVVVDHQLQEGSAQVARQASEVALSLGATAEIRTVEVEGPGEGPARQARYAALGAAADGRPLLVAHTADDDAEGMLIGLVRGSGAEAIAGMRSVHTDHVAVTAGAAWLGRPLLNCTREETEAECRAAGLRCGRIRTTLAMHTCAAASALTYCHTYKMRSGSTSVRTWHALLGCSAKTLSCSMS